MKIPQLPINESDRLNVLESYSILDTLPEREYDSITQLASYICQTPIALICLLDKERQWIKSNVGLNIKETPRHMSICQYTIMGDEVYEVNNVSEHELFKNNPFLYENSAIEFYAGVPLIDSDGISLGSLCVIDTQAKKLSIEQKSALKLLADQVVILLKARKKNAQLFSIQKKFQRFFEVSTNLVCIASIEGMFYKVNPVFCRILGYSKKELVGSYFADLVHPEDIENTRKEFDKLAKGEKNSTFENRFRCKNGDYIFLSWNTSFLIDSDSGDLYCIGQDITFERRQQEKLQSITTELSAILDSSEYAIIATDPHGRIKQFNKTAEILLGYKAEEVIGKITTDIFYVWEEVVKRAEELTIELGEKVAPGFQTNVIKIQKFGGANIVETNYVRKDGSKFPVKVSLTSIKNKFGEITGYMGVSKDITKELEAEQNLIKNKKLLDESESIAKMGSWKFDLITDSLIWSKGHYQIFELEELEGKDLCTAYRNRFHPEDLPILDEALNSTFDKGEKINLVHRIIISDKSQKYIKLLGQAVYDREGNLIGAQGTIQDVTQKRLSEKIIAEKVKEISDIKSALDESAIVAITNQKGVITFANEKFCNISKYTEEELLGQDHRILNSGFHPKEFIREMWLTISNGKTWKGEIKNKAKDGSYYWVDTTIVPFLDKKGKPYQYVAIRAEITQEKLAKENLKNTLITLERKNDELDKFAYIVSHDLKAPLRAINNLAEWIVEDMPDMPEEVSSNFNIMRGRVQRMENLINGVLDYSRIGRTIIEKTEIDLKQLLRHIVDTLVPKEGFEVIVSDTMPHIFGPRILLNQVFSNLISNAVKYNNKPVGKIECLYESLPDFHQFTIKDNGPGIEKEYHKKVFEVFQTIEARDKKESTGVGLSIVKKIIEEEGGEIFIKSEENKGCSFIFIIPK